MAFSITAEIENTEFHK